MTRFTRCIKREVVFEIQGMEPARYCLLFDERGITCWRKHGRRRYHLPWRAIVGHLLVRSALEARRVRKDALPEAGQGLLFPNTPTNGAGDACPERKVSHG